MTLRAEQVLLLDVVTRFAEHCRQDNHRPCASLAIPVERTGPACEQLLQQLDADREAYYKATVYDVNEQKLRMGAAFPDESWPVTALMRLVHDSLLTPPWHAADGLRRGIWLTSALARIGELGIPSDAVLRTGLREELHRRIALVVAQTRLQVSGSPHGAITLPQSLSRWIEVLQDCPDQPEMEPTEIDGVRALDRVRT